MFEFLPRYFLNFAYWILVIEACLLWGLPRRPRWQLRLAVGVAALVAAGYAVVWALNEAGASWFVAAPPVFLGAFVLTMVIWHLCLDASRRQVFFLCTAAYALQHAVYSAMMLLSGALDGAGAGWLTQTLPYALIVRYGSYALAGVLGYRLLVRRYRGITYLDRGDIRLTALSLVILFVSLVLSLLCDFLVPEDARFVGHLYAIISCVLALSLQFGLFANDCAEAKIVRLEEMLRAEDRRRSLSQETVDAVRRACHDLKYQLAALEAEPGANMGEAARELGEPLAVYDQLFETGNATLDLVLTEKGLVCQAEGIAFSCMADGEALGFMAPGDLYAFLGNALDNAIEAQEDVPAEERSVSLRAARRSGIVTLTVVNACAHEVAFEDGLPACSTKPDAASHGLGTRSMRFIARRYGGEVRMTQRGPSFELVALFPEAVAA